MLSFIMLITGWENGRAVRRADKKRDFHRYL